MCVYNICQGEAEPAEGEEPGPPGVTKKWWQFWKSSGKPLKFGWITGVLVSLHDYVHVHIHILNVLCCCDHVV